MTQTETRGRIFESQEDAQKASGRHSFAECWCGHGKPPQEAAHTDRLDGVHEWVNVVHDSSCATNCRSFHVHVHCPECVGKLGGPCCEPPRPHEG